MFCFKDTFGLFSFPFKIHQIRIIIPKRKFLNVKPLCREINGKNAFSTPGITLLTIDSF